MIVFFFSSTDPRSLGLGLAVFVGSVLLETVSVRDVASGALSLLRWLLPFDMVRPGLHAQSWRSLPSSHGRENTSPCMPCSLHAAPMTD